MVCITTYLENVINFKVVKTKWMSIALKIISDVCMFAVSTSQNYSLLAQLVRENRFTSTLYTR